MDKNETETESVTPTYVEINEKVVSYLSFLLLVYNSYGAGATQATAFKHYPDIGVDTTPEPTLHKVSRHWSIDSFKLQCVRDDYQEVKKKRPQTL